MILMGWEDLKYSNISMMYRKESPVFSFDPGLHLLGGTKELKNPVTLIWKY